MYMCVYACMPFVCFIACFMLRLLAIVQICQQHEATHLHKCAQPHINAHNIYIYYYSILYIYIYIYMFNP